MVNLTDSEARQIEKILIQRVKDEVPSCYGQKLGPRIKELLKFVRTTERTWSED